MPDATGKTILIVEDEKELVKSLVTFLKPQGFEILVAYDAVYGISFANKKNVDLILLDLALPAGGGFFVLERLKESPNTCTIPIVVMTAKPEKELEDKAYQMGVVGYFYKPFDPKTLLKQIREILHIEP